MKIVQRLTLGLTIKLFLDMKEMSFIQEGFFNTTKNTLIPRHDRMLGWGHLSPNSSLRLCTDYWAQVPTDKGDRIDGQGKKRHGKSMEGQERSA